MTKGMAGKRRRRRRRYYVDVKAMHEATTQVTKMVCTLHKQDKTGHTRLPFSESSTGPPTTSLRPEGFIK